MNTYIGEVEVAGKVQVWGMSLFEHKNYYHDPCRVAAILIAGSGSAIDAFGAAMQLGNKRTSRLEINSNRDIAPLNASKIYIVPDNDGYDVQKISYSEEGFSVALVISRKYEILNEEGKPYVQFVMAAEDDKESFYAKLRLNLMKFVELPIQLEWMPVIEEKMRSVFRVFDLVGTENLKLVRVTGDKEYVEKLIVKLLADNTLKIVEV